jgi:hypothetical protein
MGLLDEAAWRELMLQHRRRAAVSFVQGAFPKASLESASGIVDDEHQACLSDTDRVSAAPDKPNEMEVLQREMAALRLTVETQDSLIQELLGGLPTTPIVPKTPPSEEARSSWQAKAP